MSRSQAPAGRESAAGDDGERAVGEGVERVEDERILTGRARYVHDLVPPEGLEMALVRSEHAHARIADVDTAAAEAHPDCALVLTGADVVAEYEPMPCGIEEYGEWALAHEKVRFVGEPVAAVVATDRYVAEDVRDLVEVEYDLLDPVMTTVASMADDVLLHEDVGTNVADAERFEFGDPEGAFADADHVVERSFSYGRVSGVPVETPGVVATYDPADDSFDIEANLQVHTLVADQVYRTLGYEKEAVALSSPPDIGGSYGTKSSIHRYCVLAAACSRRLGGEPVAFVEDRAEYLEGGDAHSSEREYEVKIALDDDGTICGLDFWFAENFGAFPRHPAVEQVLKPLSCVSGPYDVENVVYDYRVALTNKTSQTPYRGYGVPPHLYVLEGIIDAAAAALGMDAGAIREHNLIEPDQQPYQTASKNVYDSGDYPAALAEVRARLDEAERRSGGLLDPETVAARREEGFYRGVQPTVAIEVGGSFAGWSQRQHTPAEAIDGMTRDDARGLPEHLVASVTDDGRIAARLATNTSGQGHQTVVGQLLADEFGVPRADVEVGYRNTAEAPKDYGAAGSRMAIMISGAAVALGEKLRGRLEAAAADQWGCPTEAVQYRNGGVESPATGERLSLADLKRLDDGERTSAHAVYRHPVLNHEEFDEALASMLPAYASAAFAVNAPIVEVDAETGNVEVLKFYTLRDAGNMINPTIVEGQAHGGIVQGMGAALQEEFVYDEESGEFLATSLFDYALPSIRDVPDIEVSHQETPNPFTELGVKGVGEGGMIDAPAGICASVNAALSPLGVVVDRLPFTANRAHRRIRAARASERDAE